MEQTIITFATGLWVQFETFLRGLVLPSRVSQLAIIAGILLAAHLARYFFSDRIYEWIRAREGWPRWRLRAAVILHQRFRAIIFVIMIWIADGLIREVTSFPSRRFIVEAVATLATAWLVVAIASRLVGNTTLRRLVRWAAWIFVTLYFLGLLEDTKALLDDIAVQFGDFRLSLLGLIKALIVTTLLFVLARGTSRSAARRIRENDDLSPSMRVLAIKFLQVVLFGAAFFLGLKAVGFDLTGLAVLSGAIGVGLGFGLQKVVSNLVSGVIILLDKSIKPGDVISLGDTFGWIEALGARYVSVVTRDGKEYLIPNEDLITGQVVNWSHSDEFVRLDLYFGVSYGDDPHKVRQIAIAAATAVPRVLSTRPPVCHIVGFGDSSVDYILRFWITDPTAGLTNIKGNVYLALWDAFHENGVSFPFPQREVRLLNERVEVTSSGPGAATTPPQPDQA